MIQLLISVHCSSADARGGIRKRNGDYPEDVLQAIAVPLQVEGPEGFPNPPPDSQGAQAEDAGLLPDHVVT